MTHQTLTSLLSILKDPENPAFSKAAERLDAVLENFDPATLSVAERTSLLASIASALEVIAEAKALTAQQLGKTRQTSQALQSYNRLK